VYVACLGCYNDGELCGDWFEADDCPTDMTGEDGDSFNERLTANGMPFGRYHLIDGHEELAVHDHEGFHGLLKGECSPGEARRIAEVIDRLDETECDALREWVATQYDGRVDDQIVLAFKDAYVGRYLSEQDYAMEHAEAYDLIKRELAWPYNHIDWEQAAAELFSGDYWSAKTGHNMVFVFHTA
jgi:antirestriction protein